MTDLWAQMVEAGARALTIFTMKCAGFWETLPTPTAQDRAVKVAIAEALPLADLALRAAFAKLIDAGPDDRIVACADEAIIGALNRMRHSADDPTPGMLALAAAFRALAPEPGAAHAEAEVERAS